MYFMAHTERVDLDSSSCDSITTPMMNGAAGMSLIDIVSRNEEFILRN